MRRWIWILLILLTVGLVSCAGLVGGGIWYASSQFKVKKSRKGKSTAPSPGCAPASRIRSPSSTPATISAS